MKSRPVSGIPAAHAETWVPIESTFPEATSPFGPTFRCRCRSVPHSRHFVASWIATDALGHVCRAPYQHRVVTVGTKHGWRRARPLVSCQGQGPLCGLSNPYFKSLGLPSFFGERGRNFSNRRVRTRSHGGVAGASGQPLPLCRSFRHVDWKTGTASGCDMRQSSRSRGRCPGDTSCEKIRG
jgi:hypothetical protein